jgi:hypothetical protein
MISFELDSALRNCIHLLLKLLDFLERATLRRRRSIVLDTAKKDQQVVPTVLPRQIRGGYVPDRSWFSRRVLRWWA